MMEKVNREFFDKDFNSANLLDFLYRWRYTLLIFTSLAIISSFIFSSPYFITPKYKSTVIMFPVSTNSVSKVLIAQNSGIKEDILGFGDEEQAEQMLQLLNSNIIRDRIIQKYNLMKHYDIEPDSRYKYTRLYSRYEDNIRFRRTEYMAVKITVLDTDPQMAADIANDIAALVDSAKNAIQKDRAVKAFQIVKTQYSDLQDEVNNIVDSLEALGELGVNDYERQSEVLNEQLAIAISKDNKPAVKAIQKKLDVVGRYGGLYMSLKNALEFKTEQLTLLKTKYQEAKVDAEQELPQKFIVNSAYKAEKKSYPVRWIIVVVSTLSVFFLTLLVIIMIERFPRRPLKKKVEE